MNGPTYHKYVHPPTPATARVVPDGPEVFGPAVDGIIYRPG